MTKTELDYLWKITSKLWRKIEPPTRPCMGQILPPPFPERALPRLQAAVTRLRLKTSAALRAQDLNGNDR
jgi:hypothetical protein